jgi:hypothetical protein
MCGECVGNGLGVISGEAQHSTNIHSPSPSRCHSPSHSHGAPQHSLPGTLSLSCITHTLTHTRKHTHSHTHANTHTHTNTRKHTQTLTHANTHTHTHTQTHTLIHTRIHTHLNPSSGRLLWSPSPPPTDHPSDRGGTACGC